MHTKWKSMTTSHKIVTVLSLIVSIAVIALAILQISGIWPQAVSLCVPLTGVNLLCQTYTQWKTSRKTAYFSLGCAAVVFACALVILFIK